MSYIEVVGYTTIFPLYTFIQNQFILPHGPLFLNISLKVFTFYKLNTTLTG